MENRLFYHQWNCHRHRLIRCDDVLSSGFDVEGREPESCTSPYSSYVFPSNDCTGKLIDKFSSAEIASSVSDEVQTRTCLILI